MFSGKWKKFGVIAGIRRLTKQLEEMRDGCIVIGMREQWCGSLAGQRQGKLVDGDPV